MFAQVVLSDGFDPLDTPAPYEVVRATGRTALVGGLPRASGETCAPPPVLSWIAALWAVTR